MTHKPIEITARNNDSVALVAWRIDKKIPGCLGFALTAINQATGERKALKTYVPFAGEVKARKEWSGEPSTVLPIQKLQWIHFYSGPEGASFAYELVPMVGTPGNLKPLEEMKVTSNVITFTTRLDDTFSVAFTRGILSTQWLARMLPTDAEGLPDWETLMKELLNPDSKIRKHLAGNVTAMLKGPISDARAEGGHVYAALYELADPEIVDFLLRPENIEVFSLVLGNTGADDETNADARRRLHEAQADISDRMFGGWGIAHNKYQVRTDAAGEPVEVLTGTANATTTGQCTQSNMVARIRNKQVAAQFLANWKMLRDAGSDQPKEMREINGKGCEITTLADGTTIEVWFSPNMPDKNKPKDNPPMPPDMARVRSLIYGAKSDVCGEVFYPGKPSVLAWLAYLWDKRPDLYMFMTVSKEEALQGLKCKRRKGRPPLFTVAAGREVEFAHFVKELLKLPEAHAVTHGKIIVIDAFGDDPIVIFGSHNLGYKASYANDENLVIVRGNKALAQYVWVNMYDINTHFRARQAANAGADRKDQTKKYGELAGDDSWQDVWLTGYKAKEATLLATGVWDGSGLEDPDWLKPDWVVKWKPRPKPAEGDAKPDAGEAKPEGNTSAGSGLAAASGANVKPCVPPTIAEPTPAPGNGQTVTSPAALPTPVPPVKGRADSGDDAGHRSATPVNRGNVVSRFFAGVCRFIGRLRRACGG